MTNPKKYGKMVIPTKMKKKINYRFGQDLSFEKESDRQYYIWKNLKGAAKARGIEFTITPNDIEIPKKCPILGITLHFRSGKGGWIDAPSVDRINNNKGYVPGNIQIVSRQANSMKSNASPEELLKFAFWIYKTYMKRN